MKIHETWWSWMRWVLSWQLWLSTIYTNQKKQFEHWVASNNFHLLGGSCPFPSWGPVNNRVCLVETVSSFTRFFACDFTSPFIPCLVPSHSKQPGAAKKPFMGHTSLLAHKFLWIWATCRKDNPKSHENLHDPGKKIWQHACQFDAEISELGGQIPHGWLTHFRLPRLQGTSLGDFSTCHEMQTHSLPAVGQLWRATALCVLRKSQPNSLIIKLKRSDAFRKQHGIQNVLHSRRRLLRCPGPNGPQDFLLLFPHWPNFASTSQPWALEFAHPFAQGFPTRRWCTGGCLSWHGPGINLQQTPVGL